MCCSNFKLQLSCSNNGGINSNKFLHVTLPYITVCIVFPSTCWQAIQQPARRVTHTRIFPQLIKKFPEFYGLQSLSTVFKTSSLLSLPSTTPTNFILIISFVMLSSYLCFSPHVVSFPQVTVTNLFFIYSPSPLYEWQHCTFNHPSFSLPNNIWWTVKIKKFLAV